MSSGRVKLIVCDNIQKQGEAVGQMREDKYEVIYPNDANNHIPFEFDLYRQFFGENDESPTGGKTYDSFGKKFIAIGILKA